MKIPQELKNFSKRDLIRRVLFLEEQLEDLKKRLLAYENAHTPPSKNNRKYPRRESLGNPVGAPKGHEGKTRPTPKPNRFEELKLERCPKCKNKLGKAIKVVKKIIEDIPLPQPLRVTLFTISYYFCKHCDEEVIPSHPDLPDKGIFGPNVQTSITNLKYENRLPPRKIAGLLSNQYGLNMTHSTVLDILNRVADKLQPCHDKIKKEIRNSGEVNSDETGQKINGKKWWLWTFIALNSVLFMIRKSRGQKPIKEALGENYGGFLGCDGWKSYPKCVKQIQRCWAHLLREAKWHAEKYEGQARLLYAGMCRIFERIKRITTKTVKGVRTRTYNWAMQEMQTWIKRCSYHQELRKFASKLQNGLDFWFTCVLHPEIEPTNNKAERALRELVIQEKISKLRTEEGARIKEVIISVLATWKLRGLNTHSMLRQALSS